MQALTAIIIAILMSMGLIGSDSNLNDLSPEQKEHIQNIVITDLDNV